jgi:hypothetical protein
MGRSGANRRNVHFQNSRPKVVGESEACVRQLVFCCEIVVKVSNMRNITRAMAWTSSGVVVCAQRGAKKSGHVDVGA